MPLEAAHRGNGDIAIFSKLKHMNRQELIQSATKKGYAIQQSPDGTEVGINKGKWSWHWFKFYDASDDAYAFFDHTYSMNTGISKRGTIHGIKVMDSLR